MRDPLNNLRMTLKEAMDSLWTRVQGIFSSLDEKIADISASAITQETDPTVPAWAKAQQKPTYTAAEVGALSSSDVANNLTTTTAGKVLDARQGKALKDAIPTKTSDLTNDGDGTSAFATLADVPTKTSDLTNDGDGTSAFVRMVDLPSSAPTKTSDLINDGDDGTSPFVTYYRLMGYMPWVIITAEMDIHEMWQEFYGIKQSPEGEGRMTYIPAAAMAVIAPTGSTYDRYKGCTFRGLAFVQKNSLTWDSYRLLGWMSGTNISDLVECHIKFDMDTHGEYTVEIASLNAFNVSPV